jgi:hypothetical protein
LAEAYSWQLIGNRADDGTDRFQRCAPAERPDPQVLCNKASILVGAGMRYILIQRSTLNNRQPAPGRRPAHQCGCSFKRPPLSVRDLGVVGCDLGLTRQIEAGRHIRAHQPKPVVSYYWG